MRAIFIFKHVEVLVELSPFLLTFDIHIFVQVKDALRYINEEVVHLTEYFSHIVGYDHLGQDLFLSFTEPFYFKFPMRSERYRELLQILR